MGTRNKPEIQNRIKISWKKGISKPFPLTTKRFIYRRNFLQHLTSSFVRKFSQHFQKVFPITRCFSSLNNSEFYVFVCVFFVFVFYRSSILLIENGRWALKGIKITLLLQGIVWGVGDIHKIYRTVNQLLLEATPITKASGRSIILS